MYIAARAYDTRGCGTDIITTYSLRQDQLEFAATTVQSAPFPFSLKSRGYKDTLLLFTISKILLSMSVPRNAATSAHYLAEDRSAEVIRWAVASVVLSLSMFMCRIAARLISKAGITASDYVLFLGMISCWVVAAVDIWGKDLCKFSMNDAH